MPDVPNPAAVPGIMPSEIAGGMKDLPIEADPHFGTEDSSDTKTPDADDDHQQTDIPQDKR